MRQTRAISNSLISAISPTLTFFECLQLSDYCIINLHLHSTMQFFSSLKTIIRKPTITGRKQSKISAKIETSSLNQKVITVGQKSTHTQKLTKTPSTDQESMKANTYNRNHTLRLKSHKRWIAANSKFLKIRIKKMSRKRMQKLEKDSFTQKQSLFRIFQKTITFLLSLIVIQSITITIIIMIKKT